MQKIKDFCKRHRLLWLTLLVALAAAAVAAWAGFDLGQRVDNQPVYEIVNDDYTRTVVIPATADAATQDDGTTGLYLPVPLKSGQRIYGVRLDLTTHNWAFRQGTLYAALLDADGNAVANGELDCITIKDDTFAAITFDAPYTAPGTADAEADYDLANPNMTLRLWYTPGDDWDVYHLLGLWTDADTSQQMTRRNANGTTDSIVGHPALQYVVNDSGSWSHVISRLLGVLTFAAVVAGFILLTHRAKLWQVVLVCGAVLGVAFAFLTPPLVGPDEYTHLAAAYEMASRLGGETPADENGCLLVRESDAPHFGTRSGEIGILAYKAEALARQNEAGGPDALTAVSEAKAGQGSGNYLPQALGIRLARNAGANFYTMLRQARTFNLIFYLLLAVLAVALAPAAVRGLLACIALLPMPLQLAGSLSPDASVLGMVFCYTALCLRLRTKKAVWWEKILLIALGGAVGPGKAIYLPVVLLCFIIPADNLVGPAEFVRGSFGARVRSGQLIREAVLVLAGCLWLSANLGELAYAARDMNRMLLAVGAVGIILLLALMRRLYEKVQNDAKKLRLLKGALACAVVLAVVGGVLALSRMGGGLAPDQLLMTNPNGDSIWTFSLGYICRNLPATAKLLLRTIPAQGALWLQGILGTTLGEPIVYRIDVSWLLGVGLVLALLAAALPVRDEPDKPLLGRRTGFGVLGIILCVAAASLVVALNWTPINYETLFGMQGRYWLPVLPLALLLVKGNRSVCARRDLSRGAALAVTACTLLTLLQGYSLYASWQPVS